MIAVEVLGDAPVNFDGIAEIYDSVFAPHIVEHYLNRRVDYILRHCPGSSALDVGAGTGLLAERLQDRGLSVVALDPFAEMLNRLRLRRPDMATVVGRGDALPFEDHCFDLTYSVAVMHHIADPVLVKMTLTEMVRVTRPGGRIVVWDHNPLNPYWPLVMARVPQDNGAERLVPLRELVAGLRGSGATVLRAERLGLMPEFVPAPMMQLARVLEAAWEHVPLARRFSSHNVVLAQKPG